MAIDNAREEIDRLIEDRKVIKEKIGTNVGLQSRIDKTLTKTLILYVASYHENKMIKILIDLFKTDSSHAYIQEFVISSSFHTRNFSKLFDWRPPKPGRISGRSFFKKFGDKFNKYMSSKMSNDAHLKESVSAFIQIGHLRNKLVHNNMADFDLETNAKTIEDVYDLYKQSDYFIRTLDQNFRECFKE